MANYSGNGWDSAYQTLLQQLSNLHSDSDFARQTVGTRLTNTTDQFASSFKNLVGRDPTQAEIDKFLSQSAGNLIANSNNGLGRSENDPQAILQGINQFIGSNFQQAANDTALEKLKGQTTEANRLGDLYQSQGDTAINATQDALLNYQSKLFDRLRPNLLTSLKAQGLLDTGGMNEAMAGVQGDLANNASSYIAGLKYQNDTDANKIRFGGESAPYYYQQGLITQQPQAFANANAAAMDFNNKTFFDNLNFQHQLGLIKAQTDAQESLQPSFLKNLGTSFANSFGTSLGNGAGMFTNNSMFGSRKAPTGAEFAGLI